MPQAAALALDLVFQAGRQIPPVSRAQRLELLTPVPSGWLEVADALGHQKPLDAARMLAAFVDEPSPFPAATAIVLLLEARHSHNPADPRLATFHRHQRAQQRRRIEAVRLGAA
ncbi:hypothetical protein X745_30730 [Mesorhizobium sp. LNJC374B00]|nr:hypothetical protein X745_30730 [Mesorhizobium sp. LNJC374B00]